MGRGDTQGFDSSSPASCGVRCARVWMDARRVVHCVAAALLAGPTGLHAAALYATPFRMARQTIKLQAQSFQHDPLCSPLLLRISCTGGRRANLSLPTGAQVAPHSLRRRNGRNPSPGIGPSLSRVAKPRRRGRSRTKFSTMHVVHAGPSSLGEEYSGWYETLDRTGTPEGRRRLYGYRTSRYPLPRSWSYNPSRVHATC